MYNNIRLIYAPKTLFDHYQWADICVGASSTSRYEAAACGLPMIFAAIYPQHVSFSKRFSNFKTAHYAGFADTITVTEWRTKLTALLQDSRAYIAMTEALSRMRRRQFGSDYLAKTIINIFLADEGKI